MPDLIISVLAAAATAAVVLWRPWTAWTTPPPRRRILHLVDGTSLDGTLVARRRGELVLHDAKVVADEPVEIAGEVTVPRSRVAWSQKP